MITKPVIFTPISENVFITNHYSIELCKANPNKLFVFGDNVKRIGLGGQAIIRNCINSFGIATKVMPTMKQDAFFKDTKEHKVIMQNDLFALYDIYKGIGKNSTSIFSSIVFPSKGLGTGLARLNETAPILFMYLTDILYRQYRYINSKQALEKLNLLGTTYKY